MIQLRQSNCFLLCTKSCAFWPATGWPTKNQGKLCNLPALVHEAYLRLVGNENDPSWDNRGHFFAAAAEAMRRILVDTARRKMCLKRGNDRQRVDLPSQIEGPLLQIENVLLVDEALTQLAAEDRQSAELVKMRFFAGLSISEAAAALGISRTNAYEQWKFARAAAERFTNRRAPSRHQLRCQEG